MTITAKIIADSYNAHNTRLTTMQLRYQRFIHPEFMTHRQFSRNASSSRAVPVERLIQDIIEDTAMPIHWGKNQPGMQAREEHGALLVVNTDVGTTAMDRGAAWKFARDQAITAARAFNDAGYHKQVVNRLLEPFAHINVIVTATDWDNFFELRLHPDAQPEIHELAKQMKMAMDASVPGYVEDGDWHLPYLRKEEKDLYSLADQRAISAARCARVSYMTHDGKPTDPVKDLELARQLWKDQHLSPFEHQASPCAGRHANFYNWIQARHWIG